MVGDESLSYMFKRMGRIFKGSNGFSLKDNGFEASLGIKDRNVP